MGTVFRARDKNGSVVALKLIREVLDASALEERFLREATVSVPHPNIVQVVQAGTEEDEPAFIAFEFLEGETLRERLERGVLSISQCIDIAVQTCKGLSAAHQQGIVHRDIKPSNLFLCRDGTLKILDFGVALFRNQKTRLTVTGGFVGTLGYISPEQAEGLVDIEARSDIWSLGTVLYEALTGQTPFHRESALSTVVAILMGPVPPLDVLRPDSPPELIRIVERCLQKDPSERWSSAKELLDVLIQLGSGSSVRKTAVSKKTITADEHRVVALLLAKGVHDPHHALQTIEREGGQAQTILGEQILGIFGGQVTVGDEALRALHAARLVRPFSERISLSMDRAYATKTGIRGLALDTAEQGCDVGAQGIAIDSEVRRNLPSTLTMHPLSKDFFDVPPRNCIF